MTTALEGNVHNIALEGTFDDCQDLVKALFSDAAFRDEMKLSAVNSINWARIMAQIAYYVAAAVALGAPERRLAFAVPTGNFGNVYAGYAARRIGVPIDRLIVASNENDILTRFLESGAMSVSQVRPTYSPSMDIQVSSNFERLLFDLLGRDGAAVERTMTAFRAEGRYDLDRECMESLRELFSGACVSSSPVFAWTTQERWRKFDVPMRRPASLSIRTVPSAWQRPGPAAARGRRLSSPWRRHTRRSFPTRWKKRPAGGQSCRRVWPTCSSARSAVPACPTTSPA
jgi:hypothetical protein